MYNITCFVYIGREVDQCMLNIEYVSIGRRIRARRNSKKYSQQELADILGISLQYYGNLERGERTLSLQMAMKISSVLGITLDALVYDISKENNSEIDEELSSLLNVCNDSEKKKLITIIRTVFPH